MAEPDAQDAPKTREIRFLESMPKPLIAAFLVLAVGGVGLFVYLMARPPTPVELPLAERRSPPVGTLSHDVVEFKLVAVPSPLPPTPTPCPAMRGVVIEGGEGAQDRLGGVLRSLCRLLGSGPPELDQAIHGLGRARLRFALMTRTGDQTTADLATGRILIAIALSRTNVAPVIIAPLLAHEGWHLAKGLPATAGEEFGARVAELGACRALIDPDRFPRGCLDAQALVQLGVQRAVEALVGAGFPR